MKNPDRDPKILKMEKEMMFNNSILKGTTRQIAVNFLPEDLDIDYWLKLTKNDIAIETIKDCLKNTKEEYLQDQYIDLFKKIGMNFFISYPDFVNKFNFNMSQAKLIKNNIITMLN